MVRTTKYGGSAGVFVRRSKVNLSVRIHPLASETFAGISPASTMMIGWDNVKCRPIYQDKISSNASSRHDASENEKDDKSIIAGSAHCFSQANAAISDSASSIIETKNSRRTARTYGSKKRTPALFESELEIDAAVAMVNNAKLTEHQGSVNNFETTTSSPIPSTLFSPAAPFGGSICATLNSASKPSPKKVVVQGMVNMKVKEKQQDDETIIKKPSKKKPKIVSNKKPTCLDFDGSQQPACATSVEQAKAYFDRLDETHKLVVTQGSTPIAPGRPCIRTQRKIDLDACRMEYGLYVKALTGISTPLQLEQFASHRASFFASSKPCFDGLLDGP